MIKLQITTPSFEFFPGRRWSQRYWLSWDHYKQGGPVFLLIGGEGAESPGWLEAGALHDYALQYSGAMFILGMITN